MTRHGSRTQCYVTPPSRKYLSFFRAITFQRRENNRIFFIFQRIKKPTITYKQRRRRRRRKLKTRDRLLIENEHFCTKSSLYKLGKDRRVSKGLQQNGRWPWFLGNFSSTKEYRLIRPDDTGCLHLIWETFSRHRIDQRTRVSIRCCPIEWKRYSIDSKPAPPLFRVSRDIYYTYIYVFAVVWPAFGSQPRKICW